MITFRNTRIDPRITARKALLAPRRARRITPLPKARPAAAARPVLRCCWQAAGDGSRLVMSWTSDPGQGAGVVLLRRRPYPAMRRGAR